MSSAWWVDRSAMLGLDETKFGIAEPHHDDLRNSSIRPEWPSVLSNSKRWSKESVPSADTAPDLAPSIGLVVDAAMANGGGERVPSFLEQARLIVDTVNAGDALDVDREQVRRTHEAMLER